MRKILEKPGTGVLVCEQTVNNGTKQKKLPLAKRQKENFRHKKSTSPG